MVGRRFLYTAKLLQHSGREEADYRSAISRAYYSCFLEIREIAFKTCHRKSRSKFSDSSHSSLAKCLKTYGQIEEVRKIGITLDGLLSKRVLADYKLNEKMTNEDAGEAIEEAEIIFEMLDHTSRDQVGKAVDEYIKITYPGLI